MRNSLIKIRVTNMNHHLQKLEKSKKKKKATNFRFHYQIRKRKTMRKMEREQLSLFSKRWQQLNQNKTLTFFFLLWSPVPTKDHPKSFTPYSLFLLVFFYWPSSSLLFATSENQLLNCSFLSSFLSSPLVTRPHQKKDPPGKASCSWLLIAEPSRQ